MMSKRKSKWMSGEEAIEHVMKSRGCSRERAMAELIVKVNEGKLPAYNKHRKPLRKDHPIYERDP